MSSTSRNKHKLTAQSQSAEAVQPTKPSTDPERVKKDEEARYQSYLDERKSLVEGEQSGADQLDKNILTLAAGGLAISIVFIEKIAPKPDETTLAYLYFGWGSLVLSLCAMLSSFLTSQHAYRRQRRILEETFFSEPGNRPNTRNRWARFTSALNWLSILAFVFGVIMLGVFSTLNVKLKTSNKANTTTVPTK